MPSIETFEFVGNLALGEVVVLLGNEIGLTERGSDSSAMIGFLQSSEKRSTTYLPPRIVSIYLELCAWPGILYKKWNNWNLLARCNIRTSSPGILERVVENVLAFQTRNGIEKMYTMDRIFLQTIIAGNRIIHGPYNPVGRFSNHRMSNNAASW